MPQQIGTARTLPTISWSYSSRSYQDFTDQEAGLDGFAQHYRQLSKGSFSGRIEVLNLGDVCLMRERANRAMENEFHYPGEMMCFAFALGSQTHGKGSFGELAPGSGVAPPAGRDNRIFMREDMDLMIVALPEDGEIRDAMERRPLPGATFASWLCTLLDMTRLGYARENVMTHLPDLIRDHLSLLGAQAHDRILSSGKDRAVFDEITVACRELMPEDMTVSCLSQTLNRSRQELRQACVNLTGARLDTLLAAWRMNDVYRSLHCNAEKLPVGKTALDHGYTHAGRFSLAFREMFGKCPKDARCRS